METKDGEEECEERKVNKETREKREVEEKIGRKKKREKKTIKKMQSNSHKEDLKGTGKRAMEGRE